MSVVELIAVAMVTIASQFLGWTIKNIIDERIEKQVHIHDLHIQHSYLPKEFDQYGVKAGKIKAVCSKCKQASLMDCSIFRYELGKFTVRIYDETG